MSIWSQKHSDLARLAKSLKDRNAQTRRGLADRGRMTAWQEKPLTLRFDGDNRSPGLSSQAAGPPSLEVSCSPEEPQLSCDRLSLIDADAGIPNEPDRGRVDSFSSADSAISPDFHGCPPSPLSPILKRTLEVADNGASGSCKELFLSPKRDTLAPKGLDKKVTFMITCDEVGADLQNDNDEDTPDESLCSAVQYNGAKEVFHESSDCVSNNSTGGHDTDPLGLVTPEGCSIGRSKLESEVYSTTVSCASSAMDYLKQEQVTQSELIPHCDIGHNDNVLGERREREEPIPAKHLPTTTMSTFIPVTESVLEAKGVASLTQSSTQPANGVFPANLETMLPGDIANSDERSFAHEASEAESFHSNGSYHETDDSVLPSPHVASELRNDHCEIEDHNNPHETGRGSRADNENFQQPESRLPETNNNNFSDDIYTDVDMKRAKLMDHTASKAITSSIIPSHTSVNVSTQDPGVPLNFSKELNMLLISVLAEHRKKQNSQQQKPVLVDDSDCPDGVKSNACRHGYFAIGNKDNASHKPVDQSLKQPFIPDEKILVSSISNQLTETHVIQDLKLQQKGTEKAPGVERLFQTETDSDGYSLHLHSLPVNQTKLKQSPRISSSHSTSAAETTIHSLKEENNIGSHYILSQKSQFVPCPPYVQSGVPFESLSSLPSNQNVFFPLETSKSPSTISQPISGSDIPTHGITASQSLVVAPLAQTARCAPISGNISASLMPPRTLSSDVIVCKSSLAVPQIQTKSQDTQTEIKPNHLLKPSHTYPHCSQLLPSPNGFLTKPLSPTCPPPYLSNTSCSYDSNTRANQTQQSCLNVSSMSINSLPFPLTLPRDNGNTLTTFASNIRSNTAQYLIPTKTFGAKGPLGFFTNDQAEPSLVWSSSLPSQSRHRRTYPETFVSSISSPNMNLSHRHTHPEAFISLVSSSNNTKLNTEAPHFVRTLSHSGDHYRKDLSLGTVRGIEPTVSSFLSEQSVGMGQNSSNKSLDLSESTDDSAESVSLSESGSAVVDMARVSTEDDLMFPFRLQNGDDEPFARILGSSPYTMAQPEPIIYFSNEEDGIDKCFQNIESNENVNTNTGDILIATNGNSEINGFAVIVSMSDGSNLAAQKPCSSSLVRKGDMNNQSLKELLVEAGDTRTEGRDEDRKENLSLRNQNTQKEGSIFSIPQVNAEHECKREKGLHVAKSDKNQATTPSKYIKAPNSSYHSTCDTHHMSISSSPDNMPYDGDKSFSYLCEDLLGTSKDPRSNTYQARIARINDNVSRYLLSQFPCKLKEHVPSHFTEQKISNGAFQNLKKKIISSDVLHHGSTNSFLTPKPHTHFRPLSPASSQISSHGTVLSSGASSAVLLDIVRTIRLLSNSDRHSPHTASDWGRSKRSRPSLTKKELRDILKRLQVSRDLLHANPAPELRAVRDDLQKLSASLAQQLCRNKASLDRDLRHRSFMFQPSPSKTQTNGNVTTGFGQLSEFHKEQCVDSSPLNSYTYSHPPESVTSTGRPSDSNFRPSCKSKGSAKSRHRRKKHDVPIDLCKSATASSKRYTLSHNPSSNQSVFTQGLSRKSSPSGKHSNTINISADNILNADIGLSRHDGPARVSLANPSQVSVEPLDVAKRAEPSEEKKHTQNCGGKLEVVIKSFDELGTYFNERNMNVLLPFRSDFASPKLLREQRTGNNPFREMYNFMCEEMNSSLDISVNNLQTFLKLPAEQDAVTDGCQAQQVGEIISQPTSSSLLQKQRNIEQIEQNPKLHQHTAFSLNTESDINLSKFNEIQDLTCSFHLQAPTAECETEVSDPIGTESSIVSLLLLQDLQQGQPDQQDQELGNFDDRGPVLPQLSHSSGESGLSQHQTFLQQQQQDQALQEDQQLGEHQHPEVEMETDSELTFQLDRDFDKHLADMKPFVLKLPHKTERQKSAVWIKKLCEPAGSSVTSRQNRNMYAKLMLHMLKKGTLHSPFDQRPGEGPLQPLPSYMSIYFDDPLTDLLPKAEHLPDWVEGELGESQGSSGFPKSLGNPAATSTWVSSVGDRRERPHSSMGHTLDKDPSLSPIRNTDLGRSRGYSADDMSLEVQPSPVKPALKQARSHRFPPAPSGKEKRHLPDVKHSKHQEDHHSPKDMSANDTDWSKPFGTSLTSNYSLPKGTTFYDELSHSKPSDREVAVRTKMIEAKFHEEKLKLQQRHDAAVQKIIDRKNTEIEDMKAHYKSKSKEMEDTITKLERKVQTLVKETEYIRQNKDKQIAELKTMSEESNETRRHEFEKKLNDVMTEFEQEKFELQKQHTQNIQEILDDTNGRLQRMEAEYSQQTTTTTNVIKDLESRVQQLMTEVDSTLSQRSAVEKEKNEAQAKNERLLAEHDRLKERLSQVEKEHAIALESHEHELRTLKNKTEASLEFLKQEHGMAASKAADTISELEDKVDQLKKSLKDTEEHRHRQVRELEQGHQQDKVHLENLHDKQIRNMKKELEQLDSDWSKKLAKSEQQIKEREQDISKLKEQKQQQAIQAEQALEEFKGQVEKNQSRIYDDMKQQMQKVENDLQKSKQAREKQAKEFARQLEDEKYKHQHEIAEIKMAAEGEKSQMLRELHVQKEYILTEQERETENLKEMHKTEILALEARLRERSDKAEKSQSDSERLIRELREELVQANQLRKQQLVELGLLREEEKQKMTRDHEAELTRIRGDAEQQRLELQKSHSAEMEKVMEKTNERLKNIEKEYAERGHKSAESMSELQAIVTQLRGDIKRSRESSDEKLAEIKHQYEEEKQNLRKQYSQNLGTIQRELESQRNKARSAELKLQQQESDHEEK
ncbi:centrosomal protein of 112 kda-like, partial [Plakobranchus ocellatus]